MVPPTNTGSVVFNHVKREQQDTDRGPAPPASNGRDHVFVSLTPPPSRPASPEEDEINQPPNYVMLNSAIAAGKTSPCAGGKDKSDDGDEETDKKDDGSQTPSPAPPASGSSAVAANAPQTPQPAVRPSRRPRGGSVYTTVRHVSCAGQTVRCQRCLKLVSKKCWADHRKAHLMENSGTAVLPLERSCSNCAKKGRSCIVNINLSEEDRNTFRCYCCLKYKETCSILSMYRDVPLRGTTIHPALLEA